MNETQQKIQAEVERQMGRMMMDIIALQIELRTLSAQAQEKQVSDKPDDPA